MSWSIQMVLESLLPIRNRKKRDEIWSNLANFGRPTNYHQTLNVNWQVPIDKLPFMDFVIMQARYTGDYDWMTNSQVAINLPADDSLNFWQYHPE